MNDGLSGSAISICMVMLPESAPPGFAAVSAQMKETYGASLARSDDSERDIWSAEGVEEMLFLMHMPGPIPNDEAANAADHYHLWSNGGKEAAAHQSHLLMTLVGVESRLQSSLEQRHNDLDIDLPPHQQHSSPNVHSFSFSMSSSLHAVRPCVSDQTHFVLLSVFRHLDRIENVLSNI